MSAASFILCNLNKELDSVRLCCQSIMNRTSWHHLTAKRKKKICIPASEAFRLQKTLKAISL